MEEFEKNIEDKYKQGNPYTFAREELLKDEDIVKAASERDAVFTAGQVSNMYLTDEVVRGANKRDAIFTGEEIANLDLPELKGVGSDFKAKMEFLKNHPEIAIEELPEDFFTPEEKKMKADGFAIVSPSGIEYEEFSHEDKVR